MAADDYLYHVTYDGRLPGIAQEGLRAGRGRSIGGASYDAHVSGAVFLTEADGVPFWFHKAEEWANHASDDPLGDELTPVVLRVDYESIIDACEEDEHGTRDAMYDAWRCTTVVEPGEIEVWDGDAWVEVDEGVDPEGSYDQWTEDDGERYVTLRRDDENPLFPFKDDMNLNPAGLKAKLLR